MYGFCYPPSVRKLTRKKLAAWHRYKKFRTPNCLFRFKHISAECREACFAARARHEETRSSADADKPARRVWRSVKVTKHSTIPCARYSFLLCNSNFVFKTRCFYDIRLQKMSWPWNGVKSHSRSLSVVSFDRSCMISYYCSLVTLSLKRTVFWDIRLVSIPWPWNPGWGSLKVIGNVTMW